MHHPKGYEDNSEQVCKLRRGLYELKQSPRYWNKQFNNVLSYFGLQESTADPCLLANKLIVVIYVYDGLVAATKKSTDGDFPEWLKTDFKITTEPVGCFLIYISYLNYCINCYQLKISCFIEN